MFVISDPQIYYPQSPIATVPFVTMSIDCSSIRSIDDIPAFLENASGTTHVSLLVVSTANIPYESLVSEWR